jgi:hypothetical protein
MKIVSASKKTKRIGNTSKSPGTITFKTPSNIPQGISKEETELYNIIQLEFPNKKILRSNRQILNGRELDMYIPENKLAIEYDGVYFHSSAKKDDKFYHLWKTVECEKRGIRLIHVLSDEWELKRPLVIDLVRKALGKFRSVDSEECYIRELSKKEEQIFLEASHLRGDFKDSVLCISLQYNNSTVMCISFAKREKDWVIGRIAYRRDILVKEGFKKILDYFVDEYLEDNQLYASVDRRFEDPIDLKENNFIEIAPTNPVATYTKDFVHRYKESDFQKFDEATLMKNGWSKIYDCGRRMFQYKKKEV